MTTKIDGNNGVLQSYDFQVLTTGFSYTFATGITTLIAAPAGTLATGTITMPGSPADGMVVTIESTQQVTAVTVQGNSGQSLIGGPAQLIANQPLSFVYRLSNTTWYPMAGGAGRATALVSGTAVSASGTAVDFTSIPSWVKRITVMLSGVSTSGTSNILVQLGDAGGVETTSYVSSANNGGTNASSTIGLLFTQSTLSSSTHYGSMIISLLSSNTWVYQGIDALTVGAIMSSAGGKTLSDTLTQVRITTANGTDTFDAGTINIMYE